MFKVSGNLTILPKRFELTPLDLTMPEFAPLRNIDCTSFIQIDADGGWRISRNGTSESNHLDLFLFFSGRAELEYERGFLSGGAGDSLIVPSHFDRKVSIPEDSRHFYIRFDRPELFPAITGPVIRPSMNGEAVDFVFRQLLLENPTRPAEPEYRVRLAEMLLFLLSRELSANTSSGNSELAGTMLRYLERQPGAEIKMLCREFSMSLSSLRKFTLACFFKSPRKLVEDQRMSRARGLLSYSDITIDEIADQLGFCDRFAFSKAFRRHHGVPPIYYRKEINAQPGTGHNGWSNES